MSPLLYNCCCFIDRILNLFFSLFYLFIEPFVTFEMEMIWFYICDIHHLCAMWSQWVVGCKITLKNTNNLIENNNSDNMVEPWKRIKKEEPTRTFACKQVTADLFGIFYHDFCLCYTHKGTNRIKEESERSKRKRRKPNKLTNSKHKWRLQKYYWKQMQTETIIIDD